MLEANLYFKVPTSMWEYAVHGVDLSTADQNFICNFCHVVHAIATDLKSNRIDYFKKKVNNLQFVWGVGHDFNSCPQLQNDKKIYLAYI